MHGERGREGKRGVLTCAIQWKNEKINTAGQQVEVRVSRPFWRWRVKTRQKCARDSLLFACWPKDYREKTRQYHPPTDLDSNKNITVFFVERSQIGVKICLAQGERIQGEILLYKI